MKPLKEKIEEIIAEFYDDPKGCLAIIQEYLDSAPNENNFGLDLIEKLHFEPGAVLIVTYPEKTGQSEIYRLREALAKSK